MSFIEVPTAKSARGQQGKVAEKGFLGWRNQGLFADVCGGVAKDFDFYRKSGPKSSKTHENMMSAAKKLSHIRFFQKKGSKTQGRGQNDAKSDLNGARSVPKGTKMEPKGSKMESKGTKVVPKGPKMEPKGTKRETKGDPNASKNRFPEKVGKKVAAPGFPRTILGAKMVNFS